MQPYIFKSMHSFSTLYIFSYAGISKTSFHRNKLVLFPFSPHNLLEIPCVLARFLRTK